jgi:hypothetical protein
MIINRQLSGPLVLALGGWLQEAGGRTVSLNGVHTVNVSHQC